MGDQRGQGVAPAGAGVAIAFALAGSVVADFSKGITPCTEEGTARGLLYPIPFPQQNGIYGFGSGFVDLDGDGDLDVVAIGRPDGVIGIFENDGFGHFTARAATSGIPALLRPSAFAAGDYDGDGLPDLYVTQIAVTGRLFRNNGDFTFTDVTASAGCTTAGASKAAAWGDFDGDGWLDLHIANYRGAWPGTSGIPSVLYRNNGDGTFTSVGSTIPGFNDPAYSFLGAWVDIDRDGDVDLYISNDRGSLPPFFQGNQLFRNDDGVLVEISDASGAGVQLFSMGVAVGDFDDNGYPDFYCTNIPSPNQPLGGVNPLLLNQGNGTFTLANQPWGVSVYQSGWGALFFDFDHNGHLDLYVNNQAVANQLFLNPGAPPAVDVTLAAGCPGSTFYSYASSVGDVDGDGDLDLLVGDVGAQPLLYINHEGNRRNWIKLAVVGDGPNTQAIGGHGLAWLDASGPPRFRDIGAGGRSYLGQDGLDIHLGIGDRPVLAAFEMRWPRGTPGLPVRTFTNLPANQRWTLYPPVRLGDADADGALTGIDRLVFEDCLAFGFIPGCEMMDFNGDSAIDALDALAFNHRASDFDADGIVGPADLAVLLGLWGSLSPICDLDGSGVVDSADLAILLGLWGPSPLR